MRLVFTSYAAVPEFNDPVAWLKRIEGYTGIPESLADKYNVSSIERINFSGKIEQNGVQYYFTRYRKKKILFPSRIHRALKKLKPDIVFINGFIFPFQIMQLRLALGSRCLILVANQAEKPFTGIKKYLQRLADRYVHAHLFPSKEAAKEWVEKGNIRSMEKIYEVFHGSSIFNAGDKQAARRRLAVSGSTVFLWVGRLDANKDPLTALSAFAVYAAAHPEARLYMIYHTEELLPRVQQFIREKELSSLIILKGRVPHDVLQDWYNAADFFISASHYEGGGISVCEAMSCGCIPVITDIAPFRVLTGNGKCGMLFQPGNSNSLLAALDAITGREAATEREKTLRQFQDHFSFSAIGKKIDGIIRQLSQPAS